MTSTPSFREIVDDLNDQPQLVIDRYCSTDGAYTDHQDRFFCLNPMRNDRRVGSFYIWLGGSQVGRWFDFSTREHGDCLELIQQVDQVGKIHALQTAKQLLGIVEMDEARRQDLERRRAQRARRAEAERQRDEAARTQRENWAQRLWLSAEAEIRDTPVARYLLGRALDVSALPYPLGSLRYHPACKIKDHDPVTGEVIEGTCPAMLAAIVGRNGKHIGTHRTYLQVQPDGAVTKAAVSAPKKSLGAVNGGCIRLWSGFGPRGGKGPPLAQAPAGSAVFIAEGIEDGLSAAILKPQARVLVAVNLANMADVELPDAISQVTFIADNDDGEQAKALFDRACRRHVAAGREVRIWRNPSGGKDLNDMLRKVLGAGHAA
ncbi:MAG: toprim domain-containing protein [Pseudomonadota bacterium]